VKPQALCFDLDNTLIDRDAAVAQWLAEHVPAAEVDRLFQLDRGSYGPRPAFFAAVAQASGSSVAEVRQRFLREVAARVCLRPDADALLTRLSLPAIVVTNGSAAIQRAKLAAAGLVHRVAGIVVSGEVGCEKPEPAIFLRALELAGCPASGAVMVGDHPVNDIAGAQAVGMAAVFVRSRWFSPPAGVMAVDRLTELPW
jgi:HAD superfamily hydrolase (TIGR01549 family)